jgi:hypothetical protein
MKGRYGHRSATALVALLLVFASLASGARRTGAGGALEFTRGTWVRIPHAMSLGPPERAPWSLEFWINIPYSATLQHIMGKRWGCVGGPREWGWQILYGDPVLSGNCTWALLPGYSTWFHYAVTVSADSGKTYVNGQFVRTEPCGPRVAFDVSLLFGLSGTCGFGESFRGKLDEVRIWSVTRSGEEIAQWYNREIDPGAPGLAGYWKFDEPDGSQEALDSSPAGNDGILGDAPEADIGDPRRVRSEVPLLPLPGSRSPTNGP